VTKTSKFLEISIDHRLTNLKYASVVFLKDGEIDNVLSGTAFHTEGNIITKTRQ